MWVKRHGSPMIPQGWNLDELDVTETDHWGEGVRKTVAVSRSLCFFAE